jgi:hypothetical protein
MKTQLTLGDKLDTVAVTGTLILLMVGALLLLAHAGPIQRFFRLWQELP